MTSLMDDYEGAGILGIEPYKKGVVMPQSRKEKLKAELQLLEWHKMANNAAIKGALLQTKTLRQPAPPPQRAVKDDERWIKSVIQQEHLKPLEVSKDYVLSYEAREKENAEHLSSQVDRHISTLKSLRHRLEARHDLKNRTDEYRQWQKDFLPKKHAVMLGRTLQELEDDAPQRDEDDGIDDELMRKTADRKAGKTQELTTVLDSLSRLAALEQRITSLEVENRHDELNRGTRVDERSAFEFRKKRSDATEGTRGLVFEVKLPAGNGIKAVRGLGGASGGGGNGVFLTGVDSTDNLPRDRDLAKRERARQIALAPPGQKGLKARVQDRRSRAKEQITGAKKHEAALKEMARRKHENDVRKRPAPSGRVVLAKKGISTGQKTNNKYINEFKAAKDQFAKKRETRGIESRFASQTAPVYGAPDPRAHPRKAGGTAPTRRAPAATTAAGAGSRRAPMGGPMPIAVTGMGGLRVIKQQQAKGRR